MAITFRGSATGNVIDGGVLSITLSGISGLAQDDVVVVFAISTAGTSSTPSGWTLAATADQIGTERVVYKVMGASPDASVTLWDTGGTLDSGSGIALAFTGVDTTTPLDVTPPAASTFAGSGISPDPPSITPTNNNCAIVIFGAEVATGGGVVDLTPGTVTNYTTVNTSSDDSLDTAISGGYRILTGGGGAAENPGTWSTWSSGLNSGGAYTLALREGPPTQPAVKRMGGVKQAHYVKRPSGLWFMPHIIWKPSLI